MRIAFIHDWEPDLEQEMTWKDGLAAAIRILSQKHELKFYTLGPECVLPHPYFPIHVKGSSEALVEDIKAFKPDVILHWADCTRPNAKPLFELGIPMALCFAGGDPMGPTFQYFDHFFVESQVYKDKFESMGVSVSTAFGTNTELFQPIEGMQKKFDVIFPATYCEWKRHRLFREAVRGLNAITTGFMYPVRERDCWEDTMKAGVLTLPHVSAETLRFLYAASKVCVITSKATGGSQRTVLEAMSMNIPVVVTEDGKCAEYVQDARKSGFYAGTIEAPDAGAIRDVLRGFEWGHSRGRDYVLSKWSEHHYANALEEGLKQIVK